MSPDPGWDPGFLRASFDLATTGPTNDTLTMASTAGADGLAPAKLPFNDCSRGPRLPAPRVSRSASALRGPPAADGCRNRCSSRGALGTNRSADAVLDEDEWNQWIREGQEEAPLVERQVCEEGVRDISADRWRGKGKSGVFLRTGGRLDGCDARQLSLGLQLWF